MHAAIWANESSFRINADRPIGDVSFGWELKGNGEVKAKLWVFLFLYRSSPRITVALVSRMVEEAATRVCENGTKRRWPMN